MDLQEFIHLHPKIIQYERAGVEGIDFQALHDRIEKSRYLKSRQSFVYLVKNYKEILSGKFDDFKLDVVEDRSKMDPFVEKQKEHARKCAASLKKFLESSTKDQLREIEDGFECEAKKALNMLVQSLEKPGYLTAAIVGYTDIKEKIKGYYAWKQSGG